MERIASFCVNHDVLEKGMYVSRIDGDITTYDIRMVKPNGGVYLETPAMHTFEHLFATYVRNSEFTDKVVYAGPMGCRTGFYFLVRDMKDIDAISLVKRTMDFISSFEGEVPGTNRIECGNYLEHNLAGAKKMGEDMKKVLENWTESELIYKE